MNIDRHKQPMKWVIAGVAIMIAIFSLAYTNQLVKQLAEREAKQISLYAKAQELIVSTSGEAQNFLFERIIEENKSIPVILTDDEDNIIDSRNILLPENATEAEKNALLKKELAKMREFEPLRIQVYEGFYQRIYYRNSSLISQLKYYPLVQLTAIALLGMLSYIIFSTARRSEQNRVWVGLAKETAHQLGTPISSLMAWVEYFRMDPDFDRKIADEIDKDIKRLEMITARFSSIGSVPALKESNVAEVVGGIVDYLRNRLSTKVKINFTAKFGETHLAMLNGPLFEWVIENLCKNAVDAMDGTGRLDVYLRQTRDGRYLQIDISDTGKGIHPSKIKAVFQPGYTTKRRGWGLGLTLAKRIVEEYHDGRIFVKKSELSVGTTFRVIIPRSDSDPIFELSIEEN